MANGKKKWAHFAIVQAWKKKRYAKKERMKCMEMKLLFILQQETNI